MKYFGQSGLRGIFGDDLTIELVEKIAKAVCTYSPKKIVIVRDTRTSSKLIEDAFNKVLKQNGVEVINVGIAPTMVTAFLTHELDCDYGIVITASHNPPEYNGIRIFVKGGKSLDGQELEEMDRRIS